ncbi:MAG: WD40 repeat domain-containing protein, partial [Planctomycetota bacterium]
MFALCFSSDSKRLYAGGGDRAELSTAIPGVLYCWDVDRGDLLGLVKNRRAPFGTLHVSPDEKRIVASCLNGVVQLRSAESLELIRNLHRHDGMAWGARFLTDARLASTGAREIAIYPAGDASTPTILRGHRASINSFEIAPRAQYLVTASNDGTACIWDDQTPNSMTLYADGTPVGGVAVSRQMRIVAANSRQGMLIIWDLDTGLRLSMSKRGTFNFGPHNLRFDATGKYLATSTYGRPRLLDATTFGDTLQFDGEHPRSITSVALSPDASRLATVSSGGRVGEMGEVNVWDTSTGRRVLSFPAHVFEQPKIGCIDYSPDGQRLVTAAGECAARVWDARTGEPLHAFEDFDYPLLSAAFDSNGHYVAVGGDGDLARIYRADTFELVHDLKGHFGDVISVAFTPDGSRLLSASNDRSVKVWDVDTGLEVLTLRGHGAMVRGVTVS